MNDEAIERFAERSVVTTLVMGAPVALILGLLVSATFGASVFVGVALAAGNMAAIVWLAGRIFERAGDDDINPAPWVGLLVAKMILLLVLAFVAMALGVDPLGLAIGYTVFVAAIVWQTLNVALQKPSDE